MLAFPARVRRVLDILRGAGHDVILVGGCVRDQLRGLPLEAIADWDVATAAPFETLLTLFPRAVPIGRRRGGTVMVTSRDGPVDVTPYRGAGRREDLERRDFTVNAIAWDEAAGAFDDPTGGRDDLARSLLRTPGHPEDRLAEDPLRALRAARLAAQLGLQVAPELEAALGECAERLAGVAAERVRAELERLLALPSPGDGIALLRRTGLEAVLVPGAAADVAAVIAALPADPPLRLAAWLRGTRASRVLGRWRIAGARQRETVRLLALHPLDAWAGPSDAGARRLRRRAASPETVQQLVSLRRAEARAHDDTGVQAHLDALEAALERTADAPVAVADLALGGHDVVAILGAPGPAVGRALHHLVDCVVADPSCNTADGLRALLEAWARNDAGDGSR